MKMKVFAIYDSGSENYMRPFFVRADGEALRLFEDLANDRESVVGKHPSYYALFEIGEFNDNSGDLEPCVPKVRAKAWELVKIREVSTLEPFEEKENGDGRSVSA